MNLLRNLLEFTRVVLDDLLGRLPGQRAEVVDAVGPHAFPEPVPCTCDRFPWAREAWGGEHSPFCPNTTGPRFGITGAVEPR